MSNATEPKVTHGNYVDLIESTNGMVIKLTDQGKEEINGMIEHALRCSRHPDLSILTDLLEDFTDNNDWSWIYPASIGALTSDITPIIGYDVEITDNNEVIPHGPVYWHERYQVENAYEELKTRGEVFFLRGDEDEENG